MHTLTIHHPLPHYGGLMVAIATDPQHRAFMAVAAERGEREAEMFMFIEIDRVTRLELERGEVELYTVMTERVAGQVFESSDFIREEDSAKPLLSM